jgi:hypothetical protein
MWTTPLTRLLRSVFCLLTTRVDLARSVCGLLGRMHREAQRADREHRGVVIGRTVGPHRAAPVSDEPIALERQLRGLRPLSIAGKSRANALVDAIHHGSWDVCT